jgi:hypothetical protein
MLSDSVTGKIKIKKLKEEYYACDIIMLSACPLLNLGSS